jgi:molybdopterin-guanine dinucleotide biosynthesis protein A
MDIDAFILVGGRSTRFGRDKATTEIDGRTLIDRTIETLRDGISPRQTTLVAAGDDQLINLFALKEKLPFIFDLYKDRGAYGGVHAALAHTSTEWAMILACDFPFITAEMLKRLSTFISDDFDAVAPVQSEGKVQPLCALYRRASCLVAAEGPLLGNRSTPPVRSIFEKVRTRLVQFEELADLPGSANFFLNMNAPEDYERAIESLKKRVEPQIDTDYVR